MYAFEWNATPLSRPMVLIVANQRSANRSVSGLYSRPSVLVQPSGGSGKRTRWNTTNRVRAFNALTWLSGPLTELCGVSLDGFLRERYSIFHITG